MGRARVFVRTRNYLDDCEGGQKDEVDRCLLALDVKSYEQTHGEQEGGEEHPGVALHHLFHPRSKEEHRTLDMLDIMTSKLYQ